MKVYVVYNSTLHLSARRSSEHPNTYISICGVTNAHDIRDYARNGGASIYTYADIHRSKIGSVKFETDICDKCFNQSRGTLNEIPTNFRDMVPDERDVGEPSSVATDGGEIEKYVEQQSDT